MVVDHIGIVVKSIEEGVKHWENLFGYRQVTGVTINTRQHVKVVFLQKQNSIDIKLIESVSESSSISALARRGGGLHHLCFKCENLHSELDRLSLNGARILTIPEPGEAFGNEDIAFIFAGQGLNIELIATDKRANQLKEPKGSVT
jgi:methylmalonyl-CoA/ethylmalonyl-CoA epimerase